VRAPPKGEVIAESAVRFGREFQTRPEQVWAFLTESSRLPEWYGQGRIEPREGGAVSLMGGHIRGVVTAWQPNRFLGYTWNVFDPGDPPDAVSAWPISYLEFALATRGSGSELVLTHRPIPRDMQNRTAMGWHTMLDLLEAGLRGETLIRAQIFPKNAALYGVDISKLQG
jgi:uncharacterized protein YndB with AHSA1/START domain